MKQRSDAMATKFATMAVFLTILAAYAGVLSWQLINNYYSDEALFNWVTVSALLDSGTPHIESHDAELMYGQLMLLVPFYLVPWLLPLAQHIVSLLTVSILLVIWYRHLSAAGFSTHQCIMLTTLVAINPGVLWCATGGGSGALSMLLLYLLHTAILRITHEGDIRAYITSGVLMAFYLYIDATAIYLLVVLLPALMIITPIKQLKTSPQSSFIIVGLPLVIVAVSWFYFNWVFYGNPLAFVTSTHSPFVGARAEAVNVEWLFDNGGELVKPAGIGFVYLLAGYPVMLYLLWVAGRREGSIGASLALISYPALSVGLATMTYYLSSPLQITVLFNAIVMAAVVRYGKGAGKTIVPLVLCLIVGFLGSWYLFARDTQPQIKAWQGALLHPQERDSGGEEKLGYWLASHRAPTLIDLHSGYRVVGARGDALELVTHYSDSYRLQLQRSRPDVAQIAVPDPDSAAGRVDEITRIYPELYDFGIDGYELAYDEDGWRVYRKM